MSACQGAKGELLPFSESMQEEKNYVLSSIIFVCNAIADSLNRNKCYSTLPLFITLSNLSQHTSSAFSFFAPPARFNCYSAPACTLGYVPSFQFVSFSSLLQGKGKY